MSTIPALLTFEEFEQLPLQPGKAELLEGLLVEMPPPKVAHARLTRRLYRLLDGHSESYVVLQETGFRVSPSSYLVPDVSLIDADRERLADEDAHYEGAPAIAIEVLSPSNTALDVERKIGLYLHHGGAEVCIVNPRMRHITVHRPGVAVVCDREVTTPLLPGWRLDVAQLFSR